MAIRGSTSRRFQLLRRKEQRHTDIERELILANARENASGRCASEAESEGKGREPPAHGVAARTWVDAWREEASFPDSHFFGGKG